MRKTLGICLAAALTALLSGCGDDEAGSQGTGGGGTGAQGGTGATGGGGTGGTGGTGGGDSCGNGMLDGGEACDGSDLDGETCESQGFGPGTLSCGGDCELDTSQCAAPPSCGDGVLNGTDACDGSDLGTATCATEGFDAGTLACDTRCQLDTAACCDDACTAAETQCSLDTVETCSLGASGCYEWTLTQDCVTSGEVCDPDTVSCLLGGSVCSVAVDVTSSTLPVQILGTFDDDPAAAGSCDTTPTNVVWFQFTAAASGPFVIRGVNNTTTNAWSRLAVFDGNACNPLGTELACATNSDTDAVAEVDLTMGQTYLIAFYTDGDAYTMVDPEIDIQPLPAGGGECATAVDVTNVTFPHVLTGTFFDDPAVVGSCDTTPTNVVWLQFMAPSSGPFAISAVNHTTTNAFSRLAVFEGTACNPLGTEIACQTVSGKAADTVVSLTQGQSYLVAFHTDGNTYTMVDPEIYISPLPSGSDCTTAVDVTSVTFPHTLTGVFAADPSVAGSCDTTPTNTAWFSYTAPATANLGVAVDNATTASTSSRLAVFDGTSCAPLDVELACTTSSSSTSASTVIPVTAGNSYLFAYYTSTNASPTIDPTITIAEVPVTWTCDASAYVDSVCDCGCGEVDPACSGTTVASCDECAMCGGECPVTVDPVDITQCLFTGNTCADPIPLASGSYTWETATADFVTAGSTGCTGYSANGVDRVYEVVLNAGEMLTVTLTPSAGDASVYLVSDCNDTANTCVAGEDAVGGGGAETLVYTATTTGTYYFVADRFSTGTTSATYTLSVNIQ